jgi:hypothetical protein
MMVSPPSLSIPGPSNQADQCSSRMPSMQISLASTRSGYALLASLLAIQTLVMALTTTRLDLRDLQDPLVDQAFMEVALTSFPVPGIWWCWNARSRSRGPSPSSRPIAPSRTSV